MQNFGKYGTTPLKPMVFVLAYARRLPTVVLGGHPELKITESFGNFLSYTLAMVFFLFKPQSLPLIVTSCFSRSNDSALSVFWTVGQ